MTRVPGMREALRRASIAGAALAMLGGLALASSFASAAEYSGSDRGFSSSTVGAEGAEGDKERADADEGLPAAHAADPPGILLLGSQPRDDAGVTTFLPTVRSRGPPLPAAIKEKPCHSGSWGIHPYPQNG